MTVNCSQIRLLQGTARDGDRRGSAILGIPDFLCVQVSLPENLASRLGQSYCIESFNLFDSLFSSLWGRLCTVMTQDIGEVPRNMEDL